MAGDKKANGRRLKSELPAAKMPPKETIKWGKKGNKMRRNKK